jgi:hypothetical protein
METNQPSEELVPRPLVARECNISWRTLIRWERDGVFGFDEPIKVHGRVYHRRSRLEQGKAAAK